MKKGWLLALLITAVVAGLIFGGNRWYSHNLRPLNPSDKTAHLIRIDSGESSTKVAGTLHDQGVIRNPWAFRLYLRLHGISDQMQAGLYRLNPSQSAPEVARILASGETAVRGLTIIGNMSLAQVTDKLKQLGYKDEAITAALTASYDFSILKDRPPWATLEGYLLPETYVSAVDTPVSQLISLILKTTDAKITPEIRQNWAAHGLNLHQGLTLSSMLEKETPDSHDQRVVAQVFYKRLAIGMNLEADPTFIYGADLAGQPAIPALDSPYNTYTHSGLPPTPLGAVDLEAMQAAGEPATTNYLYFIYGTDKKMHFAEDLDNHKQNIEKYLH